MTRLFAISGSLRARSTSTAVLERLRPLADIDLYDRLGELPHFNPDVEEQSPPPAALDLRGRVDAADALVICSPEYAHGVPGSLKNALDWLVGGPEMVGKKVAVINASPRSTHAHESLKETIRTMSAHIVADIAIDAKHAAESEIDRALQEMMQAISKSASR